VHFDDLAKQITELKKEANKREQEKKALADVVEQAELIEIKGVCRCISYLSEMRPLGVNLILWT
jgi:nucleosome binding factor SPN SPT16 subunit